jgi:LmbE family N-acetylglucosaminyl deacetylase
MPDSTLRILAIGAHPDDCDVKVGGTAALWRRHGAQVRFVSVTNGESGHHQIHGQALADIRRAEAAAAGRVLGIRYDVLDYPDGALLPTLEARHRIIALIREERPDLIVTHRPNDYHPDHRYTSQLVCDAAYMVTVPAVVPEVPALRENPVIVYMSDQFRRPYPFTPAVAVDIEAVFDQVVDMLDCHKSQFYEWLAFNHHYEAQLPAHPGERKNWLGARFRERMASLADEHRGLLLTLYGPERGLRVRYIEAFEPCEYGAPLTPADLPCLFPFLPQSQPHEPRLA